MARKLVLGSGPGYQKQEGVIAVDYIAAFNPDLVHDIRKGLPFEDDTFEQVICEHVLEHIQLNEDFIRVMNEIWRVLKPGGTVFIEVPHKDGLAAYESIEHTRYFSDNSFVNFYSNPYAKEMGYPLFKALNVTSDGRNGHKNLKVLLEK